MRVRVCACVRVCQLTSGGRVGLNVTRRLLVGSLSRCPTCVPPQQGVRLGGT